MAPEVNVPRFALGNMWGDSDPPDNPFLPCSPESPRAPHRRSHTSDASSSLHPSSTASIFRRIVQDVRRPLPSTASGSSDTTRNDNFREGDDVGVMSNKAEQDADLTFEFQPVPLANLVNSKSLEILERLGGVDGLLRGLGTNPRGGLSSDSSRYPMSITSLADMLEGIIEDRQRIYRQNILPQRPSKSLLRLMWLALQNKVIVSLMIPHLLFLAPYVCVS